VAESIDALVPVRSLAAAKERLAALLTLRERRVLAAAMLTDVLTAALATPELRQVWIVTGDNEAAAQAHGLGALVLEETPVQGEASPLNAALDGARIAICARTRPPDALLVLPLDIPGATPAAISSFLQGGPGSDGKLVRICPARDGGTNALLLRPPRVVPFRFGLGSAGAHARAGTAAGAIVTLRPQPLLQEDIDTPADIERLLRGGASGPHTSEALREMRLTERLLRLAARDAAL
jgi:2-phospho-L-lactate guanylyltransferase